ncbi:MAG TPA: ATP-binding protein [Candidatus Polarisedimenticolia bacterium]|nr:ATP-binding protein [Candidatus Polarisedimenticolia bacterium]
MASEQRELRRQLNWLMTFRVVIITTLLVCTFVIELLYRPRLPLKAFYLLAIFTYCLTIAWAVMSRSVRAVRVQVYAQLVGDLAIVTGFVYLTGGAESPFSFLYLLSIIVGSILLVRRGGYAVAAGSWVMYACLVLLVQRGLLPRFPEGAVGQGETPAVRIVYTLVAHLVSFLAVAYLSSYLAGSLHRTGQELQLRRDDLAQLRAFNEDIIDSMNSGLLTTDWDGRITFANRAAAEIAGRPAGDLTRRTILEVLDRDRPLLWNIRTTLERETRHRFELDFVDARGRALFLGFTVSVLRERRGDPVGMIFIFQDLTEIRALEEEVALKKRMAALGEMAAGVAHELRNPMASISGSVQVLKRDLQPRGEASALMDIVINESKRLDKIIRDFLLFAKPGRFQPEETDVVRLLRETLSLLENSDEMRPRHRVVTEFRPESIVVPLDVNRMKQVFWNLAKNALKAMPEEGTLTIRAVREESQVIVGFADSGFGMSEREIATNFQPFHGSFPNGSGLGLAIVYRIVEEHGGRIRVRSRAGSGTEVALHLPCGTARPAIEERQWTAS